MGDNPTIDVQPFGYPIYKGKTVGKGENSHRKVKRKGTLVIGWWFDVK